MASDKGFRIPREVLADMTKGNLQAIRAFENIQLNANKKLSDIEKEEIIAETTARVLAELNQSP